MGRRQLAFGAVWLASCNWIAGIHELPPDDAPAAADGAQRADAAIDAPPQPCTMTGTTRCEGRVLQTCIDDNWQSQTCDFTCANVGSAMTPSCVAASNVSSVAATCTTDPSTWPVLDPGAGGTITYAAGSAGMTLACMTGSGSDCGQIAAASTDTSSPPGIAWFCVQSLAIEGSAALVVDGSAVPPYALGVFVDGDAQIAGTVALDGFAVDIAAPEEGNTYPGALGGPGGFAGGSGQFASDTGANGSGVDASGGMGGQGVSLTGPIRLYIGGGGGGGNLGAGGRGGTATGSATALGGAGGAAIAAVGLAGGGGGGASTSGPGGTYQVGFPGGGGGGALQISARGQITMSGRISATGGAGYQGTSIYYGGTGGGAGGTIVLEALLVTAPGTLIVDGGGGGAGYPTTPGGAGATGSANAQPGANTSSGSFAIGGGGGGGAGRIVVHSASPSCPPGVSPTYSCTATALVGSAE